jgi:hypothetical protein
MKIEILLSYLQKPATAPYSESAKTVIIYCYKILLTLLPHLLLGLLSCLLLPFCPACIPAYLVDNPNNIYGRAHSVVVSIILLFHLYSFKIHPVLRISSSMIYPSGERPNFITMQDKSCHSVYFNTTIFRDDTESEEICNVE